MVVYRPLVQGPLVAVVAIAVTVGVLAVRRRPKKGSTTLGGLMFAAALWNGSLLVSSLSVSYGVSRVATNFIYLGVVTTILFFLLFALEYGGREEWITPRTAALLSVEPVVVVLAVATNEYHNLFWLSIDPSAGPLYVGAAFTRGPLFWVHAAYSYLALVAGTVIVLRKVYRSHTLYRKQAAAILVAMGASWVGNVLWLAGITDIGHTVGFAVTGVALFLGLFRYDLVDLTPVARSTVMDELDTGVIVLDRENRFLDINRAARRLLDVAEDEVIGERMESVFADYPEIVERYRETDRLSEEVVFNTARGRTTYLVRTRPLFDRRDRRIGRVFVLADITEQKRRQRQLESQNEKLDEFASIVSHDLRNPLNVAQGYVETVVDGGDRSKLAEVQSAHDRMERLVDDMLTLARQGQRITDTEAVRLDVLASDAWSVVETESATLTVDTSRAIAADRDRLGQVFENLFRNAVEHAGRDVTVRVGPIGDDDELITDEYGFYVEDDGPGIPPDRREQVLEAGHTTRREGTGLGLSIVTSIVEAHGWSLSITEGTDGGARFEVTGVGRANRDDGRRPGSPSADPPNETSDYGVTD